MQRRTFLAASTAMATTALLPICARAQTSANPLTRPWAGPYGGVPPFDQVKVADFRPGLEAAMAEELAEIEAIANNPAPPTFENTVAAMERTGHAGDRIDTIYGSWRDAL